MTRVSAGARLHAGFQNLSLAHERLYGGVGVALAEPRVTVEAHPTEGVDCPDPLVTEYASRVCEVLDVPGAAVTVEETLPRHVGLGSGTQLALATLAAIAGAYDHEPRVRERAPALGRGGRSGVGVAGFEAGGFVVDAGHPTERFTTDRPADGAWTVPPVVARHTLPDDWRFLVVLPEATTGRSGEDEDASMRSVVERADPGIADELATLLVRRLLPAAAAGQFDDFAGALAAFGRLNGAWYADEQGGVYRPPAGELVERLRESHAVGGVGQSSWGPAVYGLTTIDRAAEACEAATAALDRVGVDGEVLLACPADRGARIE
ncbi:beta-ribofuranosylaminobenzene 5'-phosphate synthase family protein [Halorarius litoreus]|uniref:beta-ribofuranosylaminobenzene 5'-phosphate synthase family protein n=1 Tax=Halorarius litoreus TaxID=2962676 RepID=UPI0020CDFF9C|nr:beta-ribofuranosylaminobenzene 5'-phosphate synthase family protein [Halorarius litoreus]